MGVGNKAQGRAGQRRLSSRQRDVLIGTLLVCAVATAAQWLRRTEPVRAFEWEVYSRLSKTHDDVKMHSRSSKSRETDRYTQQINVVEIDQDAYDSFTRKIPLPRDYLAHLIKTICENTHPNAIGIDVLLDKPIPPDGKGKDEDAELEAALKEAKKRGIPIVLACDVEPPNLEPPHMPLPRFAQYGLLGNINVQRGSKSDELREVQWLKTRNGQTYVSFAAQLALIQRDVPPSKRLDWIRRMEQRRGRYASYIDYLPDAHFNYTPSEDVDPQQPLLAGTMNDRIVLIAANSDWVRDDQLTPASPERFPTGIMPGIYVQVYAIMTLLEPGLAVPGPLLEWLLTAITGAFFLGLLYRMSALRAFAVIGALLTITVLGTFIAYVETNNPYLWVLLSNLGPSLIAVFGCALAWWIRRTLYLRRCFGSFVTKPVLKGIGSVNDLRDFRPTTAPTSVMFCDLIGFSKVCRHLTAEEALQMANHYLEPVAEAVERNGGILDKYTGDGCLAFFGLPLPGLKELKPEESAYQAARAGMEIYRVMQQLREAARAAGIPELEMSVGIHTGFLSGGLVGSRNRPQFTVIGDTVNDAARVESFGHLSNYSPPLITRVMTSEKTALLLEGSARVEEKCFAQTEKYTGRIYEVLALLKQSV